MKERHAWRLPRWRKWRAFSFSKLSVTSPTSQLILQPFRRFTYIAAHSPTLPSLHLRHSSFHNPSFAFPTSQANHLIHVAELILQLFRHFTYVTTHSPTVPLLYLRHSSFSNPSVASPASQFILQPSFCFSYVTSSSFTSPAEPPLLLRGIMTEFFNFHIRQPIFLNFCHICRYCTYCILYQVWMV